ncbi:MAG: sugar ABC transporter permease [Eubacteriales bacterium]|nr:sugar ABC transporter permease [Eubacteriales bacterium]
MNMETTGVVVSAARQWWLKINTKPVRLGTMDGAVFPYIIKVEYTVDGVKYAKRKWIGAGKAVPAVGSAVQVRYAQEKPSRAKVL